jgi:hypothetical protein
MKKWANELNRQFSKEKLQMANKHMKKWPTSLVIREMQPNYIVTLPPVRIAAIESTNNTCWQGCRGDKATLKHC